MIQRKAKNIVFLSRLFHPHIGGVEKHVYEISQRLIKKGHKITVITEKYDGGLDNSEMIDGIQIYRIPVLKNERLKKFSIWYWLIKNLKLIKEADIIHCHDIFYWYLPLRFLFPNKKVFTTFHGYEGDKIPDWKSKKMHKIAEMLSFGNICVGDYLKKWYETNPTYVTYGAVDVQKNNNHFPNKNKIVFIGRLEKETGILEYIEAIKIMRDKKIQLHLLVLGDGSLRKKAEEFSKKHRLGAEFRGFVKDINKYAADARYIFTSRFLGTLEAFALKKYVFSTYNNPIKKDYFVMSPFISYISLSKSPENIAQEVQFILQNRKIENDSVNNAYQWVKEQNWDNLVNLYIKLWNKNDKKSSTNQN